MDGSISVTRQGDVCRIEIIGADACDKIIAAIANIPHDVPTMSDADKICQAIDEFTGEVRSLRDAIKY